MITFVLFLSVSAAGVLLAGRLDPLARRWTDRAALGTALGLALLAGSGFILGWLFGLYALTVAAAALLTIGMCAGFGRKSAAALRPAALKASRAEIALMILATLFAVRIADRTLFETPTGLAIGDRHNFGDLPFHMGITAGFAYGNNFPPDHPELAGVPLTYPFFCDVLSAMALTVSGSWRDAFFWPTLFLGLSMGVALVRFGEAVTGSRALGRVGAALTIFSGGLGFLTLNHEGALAQWWQSGPDITINDQGFRFANFVTTLFIPQRSILFGWPLMFFALAALVELLKRPSLTPEEETARESALTCAGIVGSLLPLVHSHSFAVLCFCSVFVIAASGFRAFAAFLKGLLPLSLPAIGFMLAHNSLSTGRFLEWHPGFDGGADNPLQYWMLNAGVFLPLVGLGLLLARTDVRRSLALPFVALFVIANLLRLSPWIWDNMKFLAPAHAGMAPFAALALGFAWNRGWMGRGVAALLFVAATLSGALEISKIVLARENNEVFDNTAIAFAQKIRESTATGTTILTAPTHNHPVLLSGRREFLGYEGHLWSQGLDYSGRKEVADSVFHGMPPSPGAAAFIRIDAIAVTPAEAALITNPRAIEGLPSIVDSPYRLLKVR